VFAPIWGPVWDSTVRHCEASGTLDLDGLCQPRLEPEVAFGMRGTPPTNASLEELFDCIDWLAPSFEIVHTHCADWKFSAAETVADGALHGRLLIGTPTPVRLFADRGEALDAMLAATRVRLYRGETLIEEGLGRNVLDGPLHALRHFMLDLQRCPGAPSLHRGDVISTGTWTDAQPLQSGQTWRSEFDAPLRGLEVTIE
jgi:2-oxo-3-hexenedioate decarboxylase